MFNAQSLLGGLLAGRTGPAGASRLESLLQGLGGSAGGVGGAGLGGAGGILGQLSGLAGRAFGDTADKVRANNPAAIGGLGAIAGALLGGGRGALGGGLLAALGSLAVGAMGNKATAAPAPLSEPAAQSQAMLLLRAMLEAMKADGQVDPAERDRLLRKLDGMDAEPEARAWVQGQLATAPDLHGLAAAVTGPDQAMQVYAAALLAIEVDTAAERAFLTRLAQALPMPPDGVAQIHKLLGVAMH